jgi:Tol biopolymer transport system component
VFVRNLRTNTTKRVSVPAAGVGQRNADADSFGPRLSAHGGLVVFTSVASNLVRHDTNHKTDVFVRDRRRGVTRRLSVGPHGREANGSSFAADLSADGKQVVYISDASNLGPRDVNGHFDIYARRVRGPGNELVSRTPSGGQFFNCRGGAVSAHGRFVTFQCGVAGGPDGSFEAVFRRDRLRGVTVPVSTDAKGHVARGAVTGVAMSDDGRYVAFSTTATVLSPSTDLVAYVKDMPTGVTTAASVDSTGQPVEGWLPQLSDDGQLITFRTPARLLPTDHNHTYDVYLRRWAVP